MGIDNLSIQSPLDVAGTLSEVQGIFSGDILIRHALNIGLKDLRDNPWQLPLVFASLVNDPYTANLYGQKELAKAVNWFLKTNVPVVLDATLTGSPAMPIIVVGLQESNEAEATLGDIHYVPSQSAEAEWEALGQRFNASYNPETGLVTPSVPVVVNDQMLFVDGVGHSYPVLDIQVDVNDATNFLIEPGLVTSFHNCILKWATKKLSVNLESLRFKETYNIVCNAQGESYYALYLYMITKYCLLRYKKTLLEGRGFERTVINCSKLMQNNSLAPVGSENVYCRVISITGYVTESWATQTSEKATTATFASPVEPEGLKVSQIGFNATTFRADPSETDPSWMASDGIGSTL
jgi:hypothetical protein